MPDLTKGKATICIVNYKTLDFTKLCLRSIRKFTKYPYDVVVVDNDSQDESLEYLKTLSWIHLIERSTKADRSGGYSHAAALDLGLENCNTEFFISMHSDAFVQKQSWLTDLIGYFASNEGTLFCNTSQNGNPENNKQRATSHEPQTTTIACVGSGKVELIAQWRIFLKKATDLRTFKRKLLRVPDPIGKFRYYNRTICCVYRTDILRRENLSFLMDRDKGLTGGKKLYFEMVDRSYKTVELKPAIMGQYIIHLAHATQVINPREFNLRKKTIRKCNRLVDRVLSSVVVQSILADDLLDQ